MSALPTPARRLPAWAVAGSAAATASSTGIALQNLNVRIVSDHEPVGLGQRRPASDPHITPNQAGLDAVLEVADLGARQHDRVLELGAADAHLLADRGEGPDVGVGDVRAAAHDRRPAHGGALQARVGLHHHAALEPAVHQLADHALLEVVEYQPVGLEHVLHLAGVLPPSVHYLRIHTPTAVHQRLDGVRDLELSAP